MEFAVEMLRQMIPALKKLHDLGFSHGDIKHENICARYTRNGDLKFTLIDFGVSSRLAQLGQDMRNKRFRGNLNFASPEHIMNRRASRVDDLYSLLCVGYKFVFNWLPWEEYLEKMYKCNPEANYIFSMKEVTKIRVKQMRSFEKKLINKGRELSNLFEYIRKMRARKNRRDDDLK